MDAYDHDLAGNTATPEPPAPLAPEQPAPPTPEQPAAITPAPSNPSGWSLVVASVGTALAVLLILGVAWGFGYYFDQRNAPASSYPGGGSPACATSS